jgi:hypothetical protein
MNQRATFAALLVHLLAIASGAGIAPASLVAADQAASQNTPRPLPFVLPIAGMSAVADDRYRVSGLAMSVEGGTWPVLSMLGHPFAIYGALGRDSDCPYAGLGPIPMPLGALRLDSGGGLADQAVTAVSNTVTYGEDAQHTLKVTLTRLSPAMLVEVAGDALELFAAPRGSMHPRLDLTKPATWDEAHQVMVPLRPEQAGPFAPTRFPPASGLVKPLRWAVPRADGTIQTGVMDHAPTLTFPFLDWHARFSPVPSLAPAACTLPPVAGLGKHWLLLWYGSGSPILSSKVPAVLTGGVHFGALDPANLSSVYQGDVPLLLVFGQDPEAIALRQGPDGNQLYVTFAGGTGRFALLPLFGHDIQAASATERWLTGFPAEIAQRCDAWAMRLGEFPVSEQESTTYDERADRITCSERFSYTELRPGGAASVLMRPMLALSVQQRIPAIIAPPSEDLQYATQFGPLLAMAGDHYQWSVDGVGRYVDGQPSIGQGTADSADLEAELSAQVDKMLAAGHLAPWVTGVGHLFSDGYTVCGKDPSVVLSCCAEILPVLPKQQQDRVIAYMKSEAATYPPDQLLQLKVEDGARREFFHIPGGMLHDFDWPMGRNPTRDEWFEPTPSLFRAYAMAGFYDAIGVHPGPDVVAFWRGKMQETLADREWATLGWFWGKYAVNRSSEQSAPPGQIAEVRRRDYSQFTLRAVHRDLAGLIGYLRICRSAGVSAEADAWGQVARLLVLRASMARYGRYLSESGLYRHPGTQESAAYSCVDQMVASPNRMLAHPDLGRDLGRAWDFGKPECHVEQVSEVNQHEVTMTYGASSMQTGWYFGFNNPYGGYGLAMGYQNTFLDLVPEVGRMLADWGLRDDAAMYLRHYAQLQAVWYKTHAENLQFCTGEAAGIMPNDACQLFLAHAWIAGTSPAVLRGYIDTPWTAVGDFAYLRKLTAAIEAFRGVTWTAGTH